VDLLLAGWPRRIVGLRIVLLVVAVVAGAGFALAFGLSEAGAKKYSAYDDPQKPVLSFLLSDDRNIEEFQKEFGLSDEKLQEILAVVRKENSALSREYEESDQIVEANKGASETEIKNKIAASDFDEKVMQTVAKTKSDVRKLLPKGRADDLGLWVDDQWQAETAEYTAASEDTYQATSAGYSCRVWATYYGKKSWYWVALPHRKVSFSGGRKVRVTDVRKGTSARAPVKDTGPWNTRDNYWRASKYRSMWKDLPRCMPEAEAAFYHNYNRGKDQFGREVLNPAAIDITPAVARRMDVWRKIQRRGLIRVRVQYLWG
jgi:Skp family chaperone for outer membrane proteins